MVFESGTSECDSTFNCGIARRRKRASKARSGAGIEPGLADALAQQTEQATRQQEQMGHTPVLLVPGPLRALLARFLRRAIPQLKVLSHSEVPDSKTIKVTSLVGAPA